MMPVRAAMVSRASGPAVLVHKKLRFLWSFRFSLRPKTL